MTETSRDYTSPAPPPAPLPNPRYMTPPPLGGDPSKLDAVLLAEMGAQLAQMGAHQEQSAVASLWHSLQSASIQVYLQHLPTLLNKIKGWNKARLLRLYSAIEHLPEAAPPPSIVSRLVNGQLPAVSLVDRAAVLREIAKLMEESSLGH